MTPGKDAAASMTSVRLANLIRPAPIPTPVVRSLIEFCLHCSGCLMQKLAHPRIAIWRDLYVTRRTTEAASGLRTRYST
jgi:hypothetical protein